MRVYVTKHTRGEIRSTVTGPGNLPQYLSKRKKVHSIHFLTPVWGYLQNSWEKMVKENFRAFQMAFYHASFAPTTVCLP